MLNVTTTMLDVAIHFKTNMVYQAGGSLCPHPTNDYDIVVITDDTEQTVFKKLEQFYKQGKCDSIQIYHAYGIGDEEDGKFHTKAVCEKDGHKLDLLFCDEMEYNTIEDVLDEFPLSIQMLARDLTGRTYYGDKYHANPIMVHRVGCVESAIKKYKTYYPDRRFVEATTGKEI